MKKDKLEQFVRDNMNEFNSLEPPLMAWDVVEKELHDTKKTPVRKLRSYLWKAAAAALIFASAWLLNDYSDYRKSVKHSTANPDVAVSLELSELSDAEAYYTSQINNKQAELSVYARQHPDIIEDLKKEFREMDKTKEKLKIDLAESNADEKVIEAIILSYRVKLEILDQMLTELRRDKERETQKKHVQTNL